MPTKKRREAAPLDTDRDVDKIDMQAELTEIIYRHIANHGRSLQSEIGASEIGTPCPRRLGLKLIGAPAVPGQENDDKWRAQVGTAVHADLAKMLEAENERYAAEALAHDDAKTPGLCHPWCSDGHVDRWLVEYATAVGTVDGVTIPGNLDVYDRWTRTMVDWKVVGPTSIKTHKRAGHPGEGYRVQVQLYGRGLIRVGGEDVKWVGVMFLPSNGEVRDAFYWEEEFDPEVGKAALNRAREIKALIVERGEGFIAKLKTANDHCSHCPFFSPGADATTPLECPGDPSLTASLDDSWGDLLPHGLPDS